MGGRRGRLISASVRVEALALIDEAVRSGARKHKACELLGITLRTLERWMKNGGEQDKRQLVQREPMNKLTEEQRQMVLTVANSSTYCNLPPCKIVPLLADEGRYIASESTFYRILRAEDQLTHRTLSRPTKHHRPKSYTAYQANQVWTWDIAFLPTQIRGLYFYLYLIVDIYSRKIVGWSVHEAENSEHAANLIQQACIDEAVSEEQLVLHSDNGKPMKGATMLAMLDNLGVTPSFSRPSVSDDNPYSEALFRTLKYHPTFPMHYKFATIIDARKWCEQFSTWYNTAHLHSALKFITPHQRHIGEDRRIMTKRDAVYKLAQIQHPERWSGNTRDWTLPLAITLNPNRKDNTKACYSEVKLPEQERLDSAGDGGRQTADAVRQYG